MSGISVRVFGSRSEAGLCSLGNIITEFGNLDSLLICRGDELMDGLWMGWNQKPS